jgi:hypothetical protein
MSDDAGEDDRDEEEAFSRSGSAAETARREASNRGRLEVRPSDRPPPLRSYHRHHQHRHRLYFYSIFSVLATSSSSPSPPALIQSHTLIKIKLE